MVLDIFLNLLSSIQNEEKKNYENRDENILEEEKYKFKYLIII